MFDGIQSTTFDDPEFKEDSVRELVIAPILSKLGYGPSGGVRVTRSKTLKHPFIRVGTRNHAVTTVPDYTFYVDDKPRFVLDAKSPNENILAEDHLQQAYSYAIHPEIRCNEFGLCNGRELAIFNTTRTEPLLHLKFAEFASRWSEIEKHLAARFLTDPILRRFAPDFGAALKRMGFDQNIEIIMPATRLNLFGRIDNEIMTATANCNFGSGDQSGDHCVSFDFPIGMLESIVSGLPRPLASQFCNALNRAPFKAAAGLAIELDLAVKLGEEMRGQSETFIPLVIQEVLASRFNPEIDSNDPNDYPPHVFKLRDAFLIRKGSEEV